MKEVVVLSGKGGTGKTSLVGSFAALAQNKVLVDCDVDAADLHLLLQPEVREKHEFWSGRTACIDETKCTRCGMCQELCRFKAINDFEVDPTACEGCGFCSYVCPSKAIAMRENMAGHWYISETRYGTLIHARLGITQENSGKLVATVRQQARETATRQKMDVIISDGPPGIGCPVISSLAGASLALLVTEPTLSGLHDLEKVLGTCRHFQVPVLVCINKYDIDVLNCRRVEKFCENQGVKVAGWIPFDSVFTEAIVHGMPVVAYSRNGVSLVIEALWDNIMASLR